MYVKGPDLEMRVLASNALNALEANWIRIHLRFQLIFCVTAFVNRLQNILRDQVF